MSPPNVKSVVFSFYYSAKTSDLKVSKLVPRVERSPLTLEPDVYAFNC